ncbi:hypothetical protein PDN39_27240 [Bacillus cereus]|nr:hypothetical protein [Bacillus cereus]
MPQIDFFVAGFSKIVGSAGLLLAWQPPQRVSIVAVYLLSNI